LEQVRQWDGAPLPAALRARLQREWQQVQLLTDQSGCLEAERRTEGQSSPAPVVDKVRQLMTLRGIGMKRAGLFVMEFFAWRDVQTPKQVGA
jgi:transposase